MTILQRRFSIYYIKSFDLVTVFVETKSVTKSRLNFTYYFLKENMVNIVFTNCFLFQVDIKKICSETVVKGTILVLVPKIEPNPTS